jgi:glycerol uptake facilitator protein
MATKKAKSAATKTARPAITEKPKCPDCSSVPCVCGKGFKGFFAPKYDTRENILTIFKTPRIIGAIGGELIGVFILTLLVLALALQYFGGLYIMFVIFGLTLAIYPLSGANLNPLVTLGLATTRRISPIRAVFYIVAQLIGGMLAWLVAQLFLGGNGLEAGTIAAATLPAITADTNVGMLLAGECIAALLFAFFFARALKVKKNKVAFATTIGVGFMTAWLFTFLLPVAFYGLQNSNLFIFNPAIALAMEAFMVDGTNVGQAILAYAVLPLLAGIVGFFLSDILSAATNSGAPEVQNGFEPDGADGCACAAN